MSKNYTFTRDQLYSMLAGNIEMFLEYRKRHGQSPERAKTSACLEVIKGLGADQDLADWDVTEGTILQENPDIQERVQATEEDVMAEENLREFF